MVVTITNPKAIWKIQKAPARNSLVGAVTLSQYSSGGKKTTNTKAGGSGNVGTPGMKPMAIPPSTSTMGYATLIRFAIVTRTMIAIKTTMIALTADRYAVSTPGHRPLDRPGTRNVQSGTHDLLEQ